MGQDEQWKILAKEATEEKDPEKLMKIIKALTEALDAKALHGSTKKQGAA